MTTRFCQTIKAIVEAAGRAERFTQRGQHFRLRIENPPYLPLTIEAWDSPIPGEGRRISVAHYIPAQSGRGASSEQEGDLVPDPEVEIRDDGWPIELSRQAFYTQVTTYGEDDRTLYFAPQSKRDVLHFLNETWAQRFIEAARKLVAPVIEVVP